MLYRFHANLFSRPENLMAGPNVELRGASRPTLRGSNREPPTFSRYFELTFEQALDALKKLPRLDAEPDGFFVIAGDHEGRRWQIDGHLFDFNDRLHRVELHGECPHEALDLLLRCFGWSMTPLVFELVMEGVALDEDQFRSWAGARPES
jgi:hypothetical protein